MEAKDRIGLEWSRAVSFKTFTLALLPIVVAWSIAPKVSGQEAVEFQRDIRPILSDNCYKCHGPDSEERQADLRLDTKQGLLESDSVVPGDIDASLLYERIVSDDESEVMPPPDSGRTLTDQQKAKLKLWIEQGAKWQDHWSFVAPVRPALPIEIGGENWGANPIDAFTLSRMNAHGLRPNPDAPRATLIRRVSFDLTGLPPESDQLKRFLTSTDKDWYEQLVDELLNSNAYGEHMARYWLDAARYGDTHGLHLDNYREMWLYRDWVVNAFNRNLSYRDFAIQQLAGDMLDNPTQEHLIGSGFNRAHITTSEGGAIKEEVYVRNVVDRVATTGTVFMGLTVGCAQCHDHKFDPISQKEFYQLFAYFNNMTDPPLDKNIKDPQPVIRVMDEQHQARQKELEQAHQQAQQELEIAIKEYDFQEPELSDEQGTDSAVSNATEGIDAKPDETNKRGSRQEFVWVEGDQFPSGAKPSGKYKAVQDEQADSGNRTSRQQSGGGTVQHLFTGAVIPLVASGGDELFADVYLDEKNPPKQVMLQFNNGNWEHRVYWGDDKINWGTNKSPSRFFAGELPQTGKWVRLSVKAEDVGFKSKSSINGVAFTQVDGVARWGVAGIVSQHPQARGFDSFQKWLAFATSTDHASTPAPLKKLLKRPEDKWTKADRSKLRKHFLLNINAESQSNLEPLTKARDEAKKKLDEFLKTIPTTLVSKESDKIKEAFILNRGEYDQKGAKVQRSTPAALPPMAEDQPNNRLGFAKWLTSGKHPLTARVAVNRFWQQVFGIGIVKTSEDFGAQGEHPSHSQLLDWLSVDFVEHDWDTRRLMKMIVMSRTYRQSSVGSQDSYRIDPENRWLSRGPRFRLDAEMLRDQALAVSGLLNRKMGGPSVKPPQPSGLWKAVGYSSSNTVNFQADKGADKIFRRSLYTFWKRTAPPPQMTTFDAPSREECSVRRERTNTPLQALLLMNEPQFVEAGKSLALKAIKQPAGSTDLTRVTWLFSKAVGREPSEQEAKVLLADYQAHVKEFTAQPEAAKELLSNGESPVEVPENQTASLAAMTMVANLVMNLDEYLNKN